MKSMLIVFLVFYISSCSVLYLLQRKFLYFPQPSAAVHGVTDISFDADGEQLRGWVVNEGRPKAILYYGGNAENIENNITLFKTALPEYTVYLIPYRGYGNSTGYPTEDFLYRDALSIFDRVKDSHRQISLIGRSLGTGVATYVAANRQVEKLILVTPFDSVVNVAKSVYWMFPVSLLIQDKFASVNRVKNISAKTYIFIAEKDRVIPRVRTEQLIAQFSDQLKGTIIVAGAAHNDISQYPEYIAGLKQALE